MKIERIREKSDEELVQMERDLREELFNLRFQLVSRQLENPLRIRMVRRDISKVKTIIRERELRDEQPAQTAAESTEKS
jgi:large subunit ribosomal protein L29